jgi:di/tricarboxylate transporter
VLAFRMRSLGPKAGALALCLNSVVASNVLNSSAYVNVLLVPITLSLRQAHPK